MIRRNISLLSSLIRLFISSSSLLLLLWRSVETEANENSDSLVFPNQFVKNFTKIIKN